MSYRPFVESLIESVVDHPQDVELTEEASGGVRTFYIRVHPDDVGRIIGKGGRVVQAVRWVVTAVAAKEREKAFVKIVTE